MSAISPTDPEVIPTLPPGLKLLEIIGGKHHVLFSGIILPKSEIFMALQPNDKVIGTLPEGLQDLCVYIRVRGLELNELHEALVVMSNEHMDLHERSGHRNPLSECPGFHEDFDKREKAADTLRAELENLNGVFWTLVSSEIPATVEDDAPVALREGFRVVKTAPRCRSVIQVIWDVFR